MPWGYAAHLKSIYIANKEQDILANPPPPPESLPLPSRVRADHVDNEIPKYMRFRSTMDNPLDIPKFLEGVDSTGGASSRQRRTAAPLGPRKVPDDEEEDDGDDGDTTMAVRRGGAFGVRGAVKGQPGRPFPLGKDTDGLGRAVPRGKTDGYKSKSLQQLRKEKATSSSVYDVLASDDKPLAARQYEKVKEEQRVRQPLLLVHELASESGGASVPPLWQLGWLIVCYILFPNGHVCCPCSLRLTPRFGV